MNTPVSNVAFHRFFFDATALRAALTMVRAGSWLNPRGWTGLGALLAVALLGLSSGQAQTLYSWNGPLGSWTDAAKWLPNGVPGAGDTAVISSGTVTLGVDVTVANLTLDGGTLNGAGNLTVTTAANWTSGGCEGTGTLTIAAGATLTVSSAGILTLNVGRKLDNSGTVALAGSGALGFNNGFVVNRSGGVFDITTDQGLVDVGGGGSFTNELGAIFRKSAGNGTSTVSRNVSFQNQGTVQVQSGTLAFDNTLVNSGTLNAGTKMITYNYNQTFQNGSILLGDNRMIGGASAFAGAIAASSFGITAGTVSGTFANTGSMVWSGGSFSGSGTFTIPAGSALTINSGGNVVLGYGYVLDNSGTVTLAGSGALGFHDSAAVINRSGGVFEIQNDQGLYNAGQGGNFTNESGAIFRKAAGAGTSTLNNGVSFANAGAVQALTGVLAFDTTLVNSGTLDAAGNLITYNRSQTFNDGSTLAGSHRMIGGTSVFTGAIAAANLEIAAGVVSGTFTNTGSLLWTAGSFLGSGALTIPSGSMLTINGAADLSLLNGYTVNIDGTVALAGSGSLGFNNGARVVNRAGGTFDLQADLGLFDANSGGSFANQAGATFVKSGGAGVSTIGSGVSFSNAGTVRAQTGTLAFGAALVNSGTLDAGAAQLITYAGAQTFNDGSILTGVNRMTGGSSVFSGAIAAASFEFTGGTVGGTFTNTGAFLWQGGNLSGSNTFTIPAGSTLTINLTTDQWLYSGYQLENRGTVTVAGGGSLGFNNGSVLNRSGGVFALQNDQGLSSAGVGGSFTNEAGGFFRKTAGAGTNTINNGVSFWNAGTVQAQSGALAFDTTLVNSGTLAAGANLITYSRTQTFNDGSALTGNNRLIGGTASFNGAIAATGFEIAGGTVSGTFTNTGGLLWSDGSFLGGGALTIPLGSTLTINGTTDLVLQNGYTLNNSGTVALAGSGSLGFNNGAVVNNQSGGVFDIQNDQGLINANNGGSFTNQAGATFRKSAGAGVSGIDAGVVFRNDGLVQVQTGTVQFNTTLINNGTLDAGGAGLLLYAGNQTFNTGSTLTGINRITGGSTTFNGVVTSAALELTGGTVSGTFTSTGSFLWQGGDLSGGGTLTIPAGSTLTINSGANLSLTSGYTLDNSGTVALAGSGALVFNNGIVMNRSGGVFDIQNNQGLLSAGAGGSFTNLAGATFRKSAGAGTSTVSNGVNFWNAGTVQAQSGTLTFDTTLVNSGTLDAGAANLITYTRAQTFNDGSTLSGTNRMTAGTSAFSGMITNEFFEFTAGLVSGTFTNRGSFLWQGGYLEGSGTLTIPAASSLTLDSAGDLVLLNGYQLENHGTITMKGGGNLGFHSSAVVNNRSGGVFEFQIDKGFYNAGNGGSFTNHAGATFRKTTTTGTTLISPGQIFHNDGLVQAQTGTIQFSTTLINNGTLDAGAAGLLLYDNNQTFNAGGTLTGVNRITAGNTTFSGAITASALELTGGTVAGSFTPTGAVLWQGGELSGGGTLTVPLGSTLTINSGANLALNSGYTLDNSGTVALAGSGSLAFNNGVVVNRSGGLFDIQNNQGLLNAGSGGNFTNQAGATFRKSAGAGTSTINNGVSFWNAGTVQAQSGVLAFDTTLVSSGTLDAGAANLITYTRTQTFNDGSTLSGTNRMIGGASAFAGAIAAARFELTAGTVSGMFTNTGSILWAGGSFAGGGTLGIAAGGTLLIDNTLAADGATDHRLYNGFQINNDGTISLAGGGPLGFNNGAVVNNRAGGVFDLQNDLGLFDAGNGGSFTNGVGATFVKSGGAGVSTIGNGVSFWNQGTVRVQSGVLAFDTTLVNSGTLDAGAGNLITYNNTQTFQNGSTLTGTNRMTQGTSTFAGAVAASRFELTGGAVSGAFANTGRFVWQGGLLADGGTLTIPGGSTLEIIVPTDQWLYSGYNVDNYGTVTLAGDGAFGFKNGAVVINRSGAVFEIQNDKGLYAAGGGGSFTNEAGGFFRKSAGTGTSTVYDGVSFWNAGTVQAQSGVLAFDTTFVNSGTLDADGGNLITYNRTQTFNTGSTLTGTNRMIGGASAFAGAIAAANFEIMAGTVTGTFTNTGSILWTEGSFADGGALTIAAGGTLTIRSASDRWLLNGYRLNNDGTINLVGAGRLGFHSGSVVRNRSGALFNVQSDTGLLDVSGGGSFTNELGATFRKSDGTGTSTMGGGVSFWNAGAVQAQSGVLAFDTVLVNSGTLDAGAANLITYHRTQTFQSGSTLTGTNRMVAGTSVFSGAIAASRFEFTAGTVSGTFTNTGGILWTGGNFQGPGTLTIPAGSALWMNGAGNLILNDAYSLNNQGMVTLAGAGSLGFSAGAAVNNRSGAVFDVQSDSGLIDAAGGGSFSNDVGAIFRKSAGTGITLIGTGVAFTNAGRIEIETGIVQLTLDYAPAATAVLRVVIGGLTPGTQFGRLQVGHVVTLAGTLEVASANGFTPTASDTFQIVTADVLSGMFGNVISSFGGGIYFEPTYQATGVLLAAKTGQPSFNTSLLSYNSGQFNLRLNGGIGQTYVLQASTNLVDWVGLATNTFSGATWDFVDTDAGNSPGRFYRVLLITP